MSQDKERLAEENRSLRVILQQNGLSPRPEDTTMMDDSMSSPPLGPYIGSNSNSSASANGSSSYGLASASTSTQNTSCTKTTAMQGQSPPNGLRASPTRQAAGLYGHSPAAAARADAPQRNLGVDYDQAGIDFVLSYGKPFIFYPYPSPSPSPFRRQESVSRLCTLTAHHSRETRYILHGVPVIRTSRCT